MACSVSCAGVMMCIVKASVKPFSPAWSARMLSVHTPPQFTYTKAQTLGKGFNARKSCSVEPPSCHPCWIHIPVKVSPFLGSMQQNLLVLRLNGVRVSLLSQMGRDQGFDYKRVVLYMQTPY